MELRNNWHYFQTKKDSAGDLLSGNNDAACEAARTALESAET